jgi:hypothetical protein
VGRWFVARSGRGSAADAVRLRLLALVLLSLLVAACTSSDPGAAPDTTALQETSTTAARTSTSGRPTSTSSTIRPTTSSTMLGFGPGDASIVGTVTGPAGPVSGAVVRIERLVGKDIASTDITTSGGGTYQLGLILGGSYRVRAFRPPDFGTSAVEAFFLAANDRKVVDLKLPPAGGERLTATVTPNPPRVDQQATLTVQYGSGRVDDQGRPSVTPIPNVLMTLNPGAGIVLESSPQVRTDANGSGSWFIRCTAEGASALQLTVGNGVTSVNLPPCAAPAAPPAAATGTTRRP